MTIGLTCDEHSMTPNVEVGVHDAPGLSATSGEFLILFDDRSRGSEVLVNPTLRVDSRLLLPDFNRLRSGLFEFNRLRHY